VLLNHLLGHEEKRTIGARDLKLRHAAGLHILESMYGLE